MYNFYSYYYFIYKRVLTLGFQLSSLFKVYYKKHYKKLWNNWRRSGVFIVNLE